MQSDRPPAAKTRRRLWIVGVAVAAFLVLVVVAQALQGSDDEREAPVSSSAADTSAPAEHSIVRREAGDPMAIGPVDAPVVLVLWTDMRCPFCALFNRETLPKLMDEYVRPGKVRIEVHDVAFFGKQSENGAVAARAAGAQGKFFEYLKAVYAVAPEGKHPSLPAAKLVKFASQVGVPDLARFKADLDDASLHELARQSNATAQGLGVTTVPFFLAGESSIAGAQPVEVFREFLDDALAKTAG
ncbi:MAG TPA: thioredoxin domain-containing protein [Solirubrobacter sp.]|nr:thioredoxin domain-containing protein [Solirubrobacter sp.]